MSKYRNPSTWRHTSSTRENSRYLEVDGLRVKYIGKGTEDKDAVSVRTDHPVPPNCGLFYFEVTVVSKGRKGYIGIGFSAADVKLDRLPGWEPRSYGYHGDDGHAFHTPGPIGGRGREYGPTFGTGDTIGVIFNRAERRIAYTKNGLDLGVAFVDVKEELLYPTVGMRTPDEEVIANFGALPFKTSPDHYLVEAAQRIQDRIGSTRIPKMNSMVGRLVFDYLAHEGMWKTAALLSRDVFGGSVTFTDEDVESVKARHRVAAYIRAGQVDEAMALASRAVPNALEANSSVHFRLCCQKFVELVRERKAEEALAYGQAVLSNEASTMQDQELLQESLSLIAYPEPEASPHGDLLSPEKQEELAVAVNQAMLVHQGRSDHSPLHTLLCQLGVVHKYLINSDDPASSLVDWRRKLSFSDLPG